MTDCETCQDDGYIVIDGVSFMCPECCGNPVCKGCNRNWVAITKNGYCSECSDAIREDVTNGIADDKRTAAIDHAADLAHTAQRLDCFSSPQHRERVLECERANGMRGQDQ